MALRLFAAIAPEPGVLDALERALQRAHRAAPPGIRWLERAGWHLTLQFFGSVEDAHRAPLTEALRRAASGRQAFQVTLGGLGAFPSTDRARVVWVGAGEGAEALVALASDVAEACRPLGFEPDTRPFHPHLTVARLKRPAAVADMLARVSLPPLRFEAQELTLYRSHLSPAGARYEALARLPLGSLA